MFESNKTKKIKKVGVSNISTQSIQKGTIRQQISKKNFKMMTITPSHNILLVEHIEKECKQACKHNYCREPQKKLKKIYKNRVN